VVHVRLLFSKPECFRQGLLACVLASPQHAPTLPLPWQSLADLRHRFVSQTNAVIIRDT